MTSFSAANATAQGEWITLIDGTEGIENFTPLGDANWTAEMASIRATEGSGPPGWSAGKATQILKSESNFGHLMMPTAVFIFAVRTPSELRIATAMRPIFSISDLKPLTAQEASFMWRQFLSLYLKRAIAGTSIE